MPQLMRTKEPGPALLAAYVGAAEVVVKAALDDVEAHPPVQQVEG